MTKAEIRAEMRARRKAVDPSERERASFSICESLKWHPLVLKAIAEERAIAVYLASKDELDLEGFIGWLAVGKAVAPRWNGIGYELAELGGELIEGPHGIMEPSASARRVEASAVGVWIVPGLAFDRSGRRLGYGGGWYDRMLADSKAPRIGVAYDFQVVDEVPTEEFDQVLDGIVTAERS